MAYTQIDKLNIKDIAATIIEEGFIIGKNNAVNISLDCDALEIYTNLKTKNPLENIRTRPLHAGTLYFKKNGEMLNAWKFDNNYFGDPIIKLTEKLQEKYSVEIAINDEYEVVWGKDDNGF